MQQQSLTAELCSSFRENGKTKQKYLATLGNVREVTLFADSFNGYVYEGKQLKDTVSFWTSAWKRLHALGIEGKELEKIKTQIQKTVPIVDYSNWYPPTHKSLDAWILSPYRPWRPGIF